MWEPRTDFRVVYIERDFGRHIEYFHSEKIATASMDTELIDKPSVRGYLEYRRSDNTWRRVD